MLKEEIEKIWNDPPERKDFIIDVMKKLDSGELRIAEKIDEKWIVHEYLKKAILLFFKLSKSELIPGSPCPFFDKIPLKTQNWSSADFENHGFRSVPGSLVRMPAYIAKSVVLMPCFINVGAYIDQDTMIDSNALVGSCAQIGTRCHISDGVTIGGVLEPLQATPVIIEDNCFIGVRSAVTEGVIIGEGSVLAAGTILTASTKIIDRADGSVSYGKVPPYSVVVPGSYTSANNINLNCAVIVKKVTQATRDKVAINDLLRD